MHKFIEKIKQFEKKPFIVKNFISNKEVESFVKLYNELPIEINNQRQRIVKKKWASNFFPDLQTAYKKKLQSIIGNYEMDNPTTKGGFESLGLFQESFSPVTLHVDTGFEFDKIIYKQSLMPLSPHGETVIFKNRFYGCSTTFSINEKELAANKLVAMDYLMTNQSVEGVKATKSGLQYKVLEAGKGAVYPKVTDRVTVHYEGSLIEGTVFDSSVARGKPITFGLEKVIMGWKEGIPLMVVGDKTRFFIPPNLGYGQQWAGDIPPNSVLVFDVELLGIN